MIRIEFANIPQIEQYQIDLPDPAFLRYAPDFKEMAKNLQGLSDFKNLLVIGHGGSITSFLGMVEALGTGDKKVHILATVDPDYIFKLKRELSKDDTLVMAISKSGETITQLEALMHFIDYPLLFVAGAGSTLEAVGKKAGARILHHPDVGGRFTAFTEVGMIPAMLCGMDVAALYAGAQGVYAAYRDDNSALKAARAMYALERQGIVDVFMPFYSHALFGFSTLIVQLCHESFGKNGMGQKYFDH